jgi:hypothetical protein
VSLRRRKGLESTQKDCHWQEVNELGQDGKSVRLVNTRSTIRREASSSTTVSRPYRPRLFSASLAQFDEYSPAHFGALVFSHTLVQGAWFFPLDQVELFLHAPTGDDDLGVVFAFVAPICCV